jgi:YD repeat-containing protein
MMRKRMLRGLIFLFFLGSASPLWAQSGASVQYVYDALGRLTTVIDPSGNVATYNYDAVGNLLSITRSTSSPTALVILGFSPAQGSAGQTVAIQGQNFSTTPSSNTVQFNGTAATVTAATANSLTVTVPTGATTGPISVTVGSSTATSSSNFTVLSVPVITSVSPAFTIQTPTISGFQVTGSNLTGATFSFVPAFTPPAITISNVVINSNGTSATMTLTLASSATGSFALVATIATGSSPAIPSPSNTLTIISSDPNADFDGDGLTNIYEAAIGTNYANASTTGDGLPDGWAVFYGLNPLNAAAAGQTAPNSLTYLQSFQRGLNPLIPNLVPPSVSSVFPVNLTTNYPTNAVVVVRFTEPLLAGVSLPAAQTAINAALPAQSNFSAANALSAAQVLQAYLQRTCCGTAAVPGVVQVLQNGSPIAGFVSLSNDGLSLAFIPTRALSASTTYTVSVQGVRGAAGTLMTGTFQSTFTTGLGPLKATSGTLLTNPLDGATGVDTNAPFRITFSTPVNPATLNPQTFFVIDTFTNLYVPGTLQTDPFGLTASFVPSQPYAVGRRFFAGINSGLQSFTGSSYNINANNGISFTTGYGTDNQGFHLVGTSPADLLTGVPLNAHVVLEFDDPVDATSSLTGLQVQLAGVPILGGIALSDGNKRITFTPASQLSANSTYLVVTTTQLTDFAANPLANPNSSTFTTGNATDTTPPSVVDVSPASGATAVPTNAVIQVQFSKRINPLTVTPSTFWVYPQDTGPNFLLPGTVTVSADGLTATFTPSAPLAPSNPYAFGPTNGVTDMEGQPLSFNGATFSTAFGPATTAPTVVMVSPPRGTTGVQVNAQVDVVLSAPLSVASVGSSSVTLSAGGTNVLGTVSLSTDRTTLTFVPTSLLAVNTTYTVTVSGVTDQAGNVVALFSSTFMTGTSSGRHVCSSRGISQSGELRHWCAREQQRRVDV